VLLFALFSCEAVSSVPTLNPVWSWLPSTQEFCQVQLASGTASSCFSVPDNLIAIGSGCTFNGLAFFTAQNYSAITYPFVTVAVNLSSQAYAWAQIWNPSSSRSVVPTSYSRALSAAIVSYYIYSCENDYGFQYFNSSTAFGVGCFYNGNINQGPVSVYQQRSDQFWLLNSGGFSMFEPAEGMSAWPNPYQVSVFTISGDSSTIYALAQCGDAVVLFSLSFPKMMYHTIGLIPSAVLSPFTPAVLDSSNSFLSFLASSPVGASLVVTISVIDASVVFSVPSPDTSLSMLQAF